ncbi:hypothetical protein D9_0242 [Aeromonas phage D9]|nr:hypothetical protein D9_0242 [Aeromonas phage D9]
MKNYRLKIKDLFKGRIVYLAEPGCTPIKVKVVGHINSYISFLTIAIDTSGRPESEILKQHNGRYNIADPAMVMKIAASRGKESPLGNGSVGLVERHISPIKYVQLLDENNTRHDIQDFYFDPSESKLKVFSNLKQAERYADFPETFGEGLESIFTVEE